MNNSNAENPYEGLSYLFGLATDWLALSEGTNVPLELSVHDLRWKGDWRFSIYRTPESIEGVSVVMPGGSWFLEARGSSAAALLTKMAVIHGRRPATLTTTEKVKALVQPYLLEDGGTSGEHALLTLKCTKPPEGRKEGRWATEKDLPALRRYQEQIEPDQLGLMDTSWESLIARKELAVAGEQDAVLASIRRHGPSPSSAGIADLYVVPQSRRSKVATRLTGFVVSELLARRRTVYVLVDETQASMSAFFRSVGFEQVGTCYRIELNQAPTK